MFGIKKLKKRIETLEKKIADLELQLRERPTVINNYINSSEKQHSENTLSDEKKAWLKEIGAKELKRPYKYHILQSHSYYSEEYLIETPLEKLKLGFLRCVKCFGKATQ